MARTISYDAPLAARPHYRTSARFLPAGSEGSHWTEWAKLIARCRADAVRHLVSPDEDNCPIRLEPVG